MKKADTHDLTNENLSRVAGLTRGGRLFKATGVMHRFIRGWAEAWSDELDIKRGLATTDNPAAMTSPIDAVIDRPDVATRLRGLVDTDDVGTALAPEIGPPPSSRPVVAASKGARFLSATFSNQAGSRPYRLFVPSGYRPDQPIPLIVMLHGCTQSPDDFAAGTRMNEAAEKQTALVVYPGQTRSANIQKCWNWFRENQQRRNLGEPSLIAGITLEIIHTYAVDPRRVYVAGISAGGAAAAIMGDAYPDIYAAIGVHSGLACGAAYNLSSAMAAMRGSHLPALRTDPAKQMERSIIPAIVFHGDRDTVVHPRNAQAVLAQSAQSSDLTMHTDNVHVPGGHDYSRMIGADANGRSVIEQWTIHGGGHAWSGGSPEGSYTDPRGPDATTEMLRFFLEHPRPETAGDNRPG